MKLVVIGNCQARPLAARLVASRGVSVADQIILHLAREEDEATHTEAISDADVILAQATAPAFRPRHLASDALRTAYPDQVLVWPNLFYAGQQPFLRYLTHRDAGRLAGPFDVYHDLRLLAAWRAARGLGPAPDGALEARFAAEVSRESLATLRAREAGCDVGIADLVEEAAPERRCFYTFNHPTGWILDRPATRLATRLGLPPLPPPPDVWEPLGRIIPPGVTLNGQPADLRTVAFRIYDAAAPLLAEPQALRTTPAFDADSVWLGQTGTVEIAPCPA